MSFRAKSRNLNKMKRTIYILAICALGLASCTKFLDIKPYGKVIPKTPDEFSSLLHGLIADIDYGDNVIIGDVPTILDYEVFGDNLEANLTKYPEGDFLGLYVGSALNIMQHKYSNLYAVIKDCNIVLDNLVPDGTEFTNDVLGTAHALRAVCYYRLLRNYSEPPVGNMQGLGVPLVLKFDMEERPIRSTIQQTFEQIEKDMLKAISYDIKDEIYRFNSDVMEAYLARLYFWVGKWDLAAQYSRKVIQKYPLLKGNEYLAMMSSEIARKGNILFKSYILTDSNNKFAADVSKSTITARPVSKRFIDLFVEKERDIRYSMSFNHKRKLTRSVFACVRTAEMQLMLAESLYHSGNHLDALEVLNELRRHRIEDVVDYTMETLPAVNPAEYITVDVYGNELTPLLNAILNERRKELFVEGDRWYELKRNGRPEFWAAKQGRKYTTRKYMYTFPLPVADVELVDGLIQNPGYDKVK